MKNNTINYQEYADQLAVQMRKGVLTYCVLVVCSGKAVYSSDVIRRLRDVELVVVEGTIYPLLSRLQKDGLLAHEWKESEQGPPRKYYRITESGEAVRNILKKRIANLQTTLKNLEKEVK